MEEREQLKLIHFKTKYDLINYGKLKGINCDSNENVETIYQNIFGQNLTNHEEEIYKILHHVKPSLLETKNKIIILDFNHPKIKKINIYSFFYFNEEGIFLENEINLRKDVLIFRNAILEYDNILLRHSWDLFYEIKNNYFYIKKHKEKGLYILIYEIINIEAILPNIQAVILNTKHYKLDEDLLNKLKHL